MITNRIKHFYEPRVDSRDEQIKWLENELGKNADRCFSFFIGGVGVGAVVMALLRWW